MTQAPLPGKSRGFSILAEDSSANAAAMTALIKKCDLDVKNFIDGKTAWEYLEKISASELASLKIIFSDYMMPRMDGRELLMKVRADSRLKSIPFVFCTAVLDPKVVREVLPLTQGYIVKPATLSVLQKKIDSLLGPKAP